VNRKIDSKIGKKATLIILLLILSVSFGLRARGLEWGIPQAPYWDSYHPDERVAFSSIMNMMKSKEKFNPHYFINPTFHYYMIGATWWLATKTKSLPTLNDIINEASWVTLDDITKIWLMARRISLVLGVLTVLLVYLIGRKIFTDRRFSLLGAWITAVMPTLVVQSHYMTVDGPAVFWFLLAFYILLIASEKQGMKYNLIAGFAGGLAVATKYTSILILLPAVIVLGRRLAAAKDKKALTQGISLFAFYVFGMLAGFLVGCPYALLAFDEFKSNLMMLGSYNDFDANFAYPWLTGGRLAVGWPLWSFALFAMVVTLIRSSFKEILLVAFAISFMLMLGYKASPYFRHIVLVLPFTALIMANASLKLTSWAGKVRPRFIAAALALWLMFGTSYAMANSIAWVNIMAEQDTRESAADFLKQRYSIGSPIAVPGIYEFYDPPLEEYKITRLEYSLEKLKSMMPEVIVMSDYESVGRIFSRVSPDEADEFFEQIERNYRIVGKFAKIPGFWFIKFKGYPVTDWRYFYPEITIYERSF
jgi:4-amino-4-deoxy-L-arabinose transferase-like glycosyltransferase